MMIYIYKYVCVCVNNCGILNDFSSSKSFAQKRFVWLRRKCLSNNIKYGFEYCFVTPPVRLVTVVYSIAPPT